MMTVFCEGRDYGYELAGVAMLFFRGEKVIPAKEGEEPLDNFILAETNLRPGRASLSVTVEREERTWEASEIVPVSEENPDHDCELHLARMLYQILSEITGITPKWGVLTGIRPVKLVQRRLDQGLSREEVARELREDYLVSQEKLDSGLCHPAEGTCHPLPEYPGQLQPVYLHSLLSVPVPVLLLCVPFH